MLLFCGFPVIGTLYYAGLALCAEYWRVPHASWSAVYAASAPAADVGDLDESTARPRTLTTVSAGVVTCAKTRPQTAEPPRSPVFCHRWVSKTGISSIHALLLQAVQYPSAPRRRMYGDFYSGAIRNPCEYYISLWSYNAAKKGDFFKRMSAKNASTADFFNVTPHLNTTADAARFRAMIRHMSQEGQSHFGTLSAQVTSIALRTQLPNDTSGHAELESLNPRKSKIDCWMRTEHIDTDLDFCFHRFESECNGTVKWNDFEQAVAKMKSHVRGLNPSEHLPCAFYYDPPTRDLVRRMEELIFQRFGYRSCCER